MIAPQVTIAQDTATPALQAVLAKYVLHPDKLSAKLGPALAKLTEFYLAKMGPNPRGWPSTRFYEKFARNVRWLPGPNGVEIVILPATIKGRLVGLHRHVFGGPPITPKTVDALAIPISPVSYGKVPSDFTGQGLFLLKTPKGAYLVQAGETFSKRGLAGIGRKGGGNAERRIHASLNFLFKLVASANPRAKREALPSDQEYLDLARQVLVLSE